MNTETEKKPIRTSRSTPEQRKKKRLIQLISGIVVVALYIGLTIYVQSINAKGAIIMAIGFGFGYVLQRSRFCFTASLRDPILTGSTSLTKAVLIGLMLSSVLFAALQIKSTGFDLSTLNVSSLPGNIKAVGIHTILGGFLFGVGAVIAGGCASGTLMRMGEGFLQQWIAIVFFIFGSVIGSALMVSMQSTFLYTGDVIYLPQVLGGWIPTLIIQFVVLGGLYVLADWYGKKKAGEL